jgi:predicted amidohydrolase
VEANRVRLTRLIVAAAEAGAELVVAPEMCCTGYLFSDRQAIEPYCETPDGLTACEFGGLARELGITLAYGWPEIEPTSGRFYNSASVCFPDDRAPLHYRKRLLYEADTSWAEPGDTPYPVWSTPGGLRTTLGICMDLNDDRFVEHLRRSDVRLCAFPTNWLDQGFSIWGYWAYRLHGTSACLVAANTYGVEDETAFRGETAVLDGRMLLGYAAPTGDDIVLARVPTEPAPLAEGADR